MISYNMAKEFIRDLKGTLRVDKTGLPLILPVGYIADRMSLPLDKAKEYCNAAIKYGLATKTEKMFTLEV